MEIALVLLVLVVIPNGWATWRVARSTLRVHHKTVGIIFVWVVPLIGANMVLRDLRERELPLGSPNPIPPPRRRREAPEYSLHLPGLQPFEIRDHFDESASAPIFDFAALDTWSAGAASPEAARQVRLDGHRAWLLHFRNGLGELAELRDIHECWVLSAYSPGMAGAAARLMNESRRRIAQALDGLAQFPEERPVMIVFDDEDGYHDYIARNYPGESALSSSDCMLIKAHYPHFVTLRADPEEIEQVVAHEMTHLGLAHLSLPLWLDEGLAASTVRRVFETPGQPGISPELLDRHQAFWTADTLQEFWSGQSFHRNDAGMPLSCDLALALVESMARKPSALVNFVTQARRVDGGAAAARGALSSGLGELAAAALDMEFDARWNPRPESWNRISIKA